MNKSGLVIRLAIVIIFTAVVVGLITTQLFYSFTFLNEKAIGKENIQQLYNTVSPTASIASYLGDEELAKEVVNGLISNSVIVSAAIKTDMLMVKSDNYQEDDSTLEFILFSPFQKERSVGMLFVTANDEYLAEKAKNISMTNTLVVAIEACIITIISIIVSYFIITKPILSIGKALHLISPGTNERIDKPKSHQESEIGQLADDINALLTKAEQQMLREKTLRDEVQVLEARFRMLFENSTSAIVLVEPKGDILLYNKSFQKLIEKLNLPLKKSYGNYLEDLFLIKKELFEQVQIAFDNKESATADLELISYQEDKIWVKIVITPLLTDDFQENYQITLHDISKRKKQILLLDQQANYDGLTKLLNRQAAEVQIKQLIIAKTPFALIMMDLNDFKPINDIFGHDAGDEVLIHVANQLLKSVRKADVLSRWGGDEFVIVLPHAKKEEVIVICEKLAGKISKPYHLSQHDRAVVVTACMGASFYPDEVALLELIRAADKAMYRVKKDKASNQALYLAFSHNDHCVTSGTKSS